MSGDEPSPNPNPNPSPSPSRPPQPAGMKRKRNLPGTPDPEAEVVALSPGTLTTASTYTCEVCGKEFRRDQNLQIHRRGHNLPWKKGSAKEPAARKRVYVCPEASCVYHDPSRALGDLTGIKKHYSRKHGEKKWKCERCGKSYAVRTDWKAHSRICGSREYECGCGTLFSRKDSFVIHRASCDAPAESEDGVSSPAPSVEAGFKANTVNRELLFPSLWGQASLQQDPADDEPEPEPESERANR